jgi:hypothetical protein
MELKLKVGPILPKHLSFDKDGFIFLYMKTERASLPEYFAKPSLEKTDWDTIRFGLESDRFQMRQHFLKWLAEAADKNDEKKLEKLGSLLVGCYHYLFGGRSIDQYADGFYDWVFQNFQREPKHKKIWAQALVCCPRPEAKKIVEEQGLEYIERPSYPEASEDLDEKIIFLRTQSQQNRLTTICAEVGHVPADHESVLYVLASMVEGLGDIYFEQASLCERSVYEEMNEQNNEDKPKKTKKKTKAPIKDPEVFREKDFIEVDNFDLYFGVDDPKWIRLRAYRAGEVLSATVKGEGDFRDIGGIIGFLNNILQYYGKDWRIAHLPNGDENLQVLTGPKRDLLKWRSEGLIHFGEDAYDD